MGADHVVIVDDVDQLASTDPRAEEALCERDVICRSAEVKFVPVKAAQARASCWCARVGLLMLLEIISISCSGLRTPRIPAL